MPTNPIDFGKAVVQDFRTGDVYVDQDGNLSTIEDVTLAMQECMVALKTVVGEEVFDQNYGLDIMAIIRNPFRVEPTSLITSMVSSCLSPSKIPCISESVVQKVEQSDDEDHPNEFYVDVAIRTLNGNTIQLSTDLGE